MDLPQPITPIPKWFPAVMSTIADAVVSTDVNSGVVYLNRAAEELTGWSTEEAIGRDAGDVLHLIEERTGAIGSWPIVESSSAGQATAVPGTATMIHKSGRRIRVRVRSTPLNDAEGRRVGSVVVLHEHVEHGQSVPDSWAAPERQDEFPEQSLRMVGKTLAEIADGFAAFDLEWRFVEVNRAYERMTGVKREDVLGRCLWDVFPDLRGSPLEQALRKAVADRSIIERECLHEASGKWLLHRYHPSAGGGPIVFVTDVTGRKQNELVNVELNRKMGRRIRVLQTVLDTAPVGVIVAQDPACEVMIPNKVMAGMLGMQPGENVSQVKYDPAGLPYRILKEGKEVVLDQSPMRRATAEGLTTESEVFEIVRRDGSRITILFNARPIRDDSGVLQGAVGVCVDISAIQKAEEALREADRRKNEFLAMLAHELRNPLGAIYSAAPLLRLETGAEDRAWASDVLDRQVHHLARLVDDLLDVSRITRGKVELRKETFAVCSLISHAAESVRPLVEERGLALEVSLTSGSLCVHGDPVRLQQVVLNLLVNAAKYTPRGGRIWLTAQDEGDQVSITVRDTGIGIPPDRLPEMFELFAQGDQTRYRSEGGLGIGLTVVKSLVELHGGTISARSEGPGKGSEFTVRLPAVTSPAEEAVEPTARSV
jgi:PAS domain S-box-containing protein